MELKPIDILKNHGIRIHSESHQNFRIAAEFRNSQDPNIIVNSADGRAFDFAKNQKYSFSELLALFGINEKHSFPERTQYWEDFIENNDTTYPRDHLKLFKQYKYWRDRGISDAVLNFSGGGVCHSGPFYRYFVFPILNREGRVAGYSGRDITGKKSKKWLHDGRSSKFLYGVYNKYNDIYPVQDAFSNVSEMIVVESIGDCISLWEAGVWNVVPSFGLNISNVITTYALANNLKIKIAFNNDENRAGEFGAVKCITKLKNYFSFDEISVRLSAANSDYNDMLMAGKNLKKWLEEEDDYEKMFRRKLLFSKRFPNEVKVSEHERRLAGRFVRGEL